MDVSREGIIHKNVVKFLLENEIQYWRNHTPSGNINPYEKSNDGDSIYILNVRASLGWWEPDISKV